MGTISQITNGGSSTANAIGPAANTAVDKTKQAAEAARKAAQAASDAAKSAAQDAGRTAPSRSDADYVVEISHEGVASAAGVGPVLDTTPAVTNPTEATGSAAGKATNREADVGPSGLVTGMRIAQSNTGDFKSRLDEDARAAGTGASLSARTVDANVSDQKASAVAKEGDSGVVTKGATETAQEAAAKAGDERAAVKEETVANVKKSEMSKFAQAPSQPGAMLSLLA